MSENTQSITINFLSLLAPVASQKRYLKKEKKKKRKRIAICRICYGLTSKSQNPMLLFTSMCFPKVPYSISNQSGRKAFIGSFIYCSFFLLCISLKTGSLLNFLVNSWKQHTQMRKYVASKIQKDPLSIVTSFLVAGKQMQQIVFPLKWIIQPSQESWTPRNFTEVSYLQIFVGFVFYFLACLFLTNVSEVVPAFHTPDPIIQLSLM